MPAQSADLVSCFVGLHHMEPQKLEPFLASVASIVRPGGYFVVRDHDVKDRTWTVRRPFHPGIIDSTHMFNVGYRIDGKEVKDKPVSEGDLFSTIYTALGVNPRVRHYVGTRPIWATPEGSKPIRDLLG